MIQANELRINDYILDRSGKLLRVDWLERDKVCMKMEINGQEVHPMTDYFEYLQPIPLTEELLLECGSTSTVKGFHYHDRFSLRWVEAYKYWYVTDMETGCYITKVEFLHEWQNTWYVLQGEELNIEICKTDK